MRSWPNFPLIYEINTWVWLHELSQKAGRRITLAEVPQDELACLAAYGFDGIWLMGVWQRSSQARSIARTRPDLQQAYRRALPDFTRADVVGSPYAIKEYRVDETLGGDAALASLRGRLSNLGIALMLDFVPNHMAIDHPWLKSYPHRFVQGDGERLASDPDNYFAVAVDGEEHIFAHGRDPNSAGWPDTAQLDYRQDETRKALIEQLQSVAARCDGVRCDMAMLVVRDVFIRTWGGAFDFPEVEFWPAAINEVKSSHPEFLFVAEVYWDMQWELQRQGFDYTYDKRLYDRLIQGRTDPIRSHLSASMDYQEHLARFIENHDELRAAEAFGHARSKAAAVLCLTLPGLRLFHDGQLEGRRIKLPVELGRRSQEEPDAVIVDFYSRLIGQLTKPIYHRGHWQLLKPQPADSDEAGYESVIAHQWSAHERCIITAVNLSGQDIHFRLPINWAGLKNDNWQLRDSLNGYTYECNRDELQMPGLQIALGAHDYRLLEMKPAEGEKS